jgi:hypothetical protein
MAWRGIPNFMHKHDYIEKTYKCGELFRSWSSTWMEAHSDTTTIDGETVYRFTSGTQVMHLPICPNCYGDTAIEILPIEIDEEYPVVADDVPLEVLSSNDDSIYLWESLDF